LRNVREVDSIARFGLGRAVMDANRIAGNATSVATFVGRDFGPASQIARLLQDQKASTVGGWANVAAALATEPARHGSLLEVALAGAKWRQPLEAVIAASLTRQHGALAAAGVGHLTSLVAEVTKPTRVVSAFLADTLIQAEGADPDLRGKLLCSISQAERDLDLYSDVVAPGGEIEIVDGEDLPEVIVTSPSVFRDELVRDEASGMAVARAIVLAREIVEMRRSLNEVTHTKQKRRLFDTTSHTEAAVGGLFWLAPSSRDELASLVDYLYILFYESAGTNALRYLQDYGGVMEEDDCEVIWLLKSLRNKGFRHDPEHGAPRDVLKKRVDFVGAFAALGCSTMPTQPTEFRDIQLQLLERIHAFLETLIARLPLS